MLINYICTGMRDFWHSAFGPREDVPWQDFWASFPRDLGTCARESHHSLTACFIFKCNLPML